jgi:RNA polymerase sigma factor (sigma-70 family)
VAASALNYSNLLADKGTNNSAAKAVASVQATDGLHLLIAGCLKNDRSAQRKLYDTYASTIYGMVRRYADDESVANDIQSEAFYRIFSRLGQYRFEGAFEGWMRRITVHAVADYFRRNRPTDVPLNESLEDHNQTHTPSGISTLSYKELLAMISELPQTQRTVFNLFVFEDCPHKEIAALMGINENNSRWHLNDARRRLKERLKAANSQQ